MAAITGITFRLTKNICRFPYGSLAEINVNLKAKITLLDKMSNY